MVQICNFFLLILPYCLRIIIKYNEFFICFFGLLKPIILLIDFLYHLIECFDLFFKFFVFNFKFLNFEPELVIILKISCIGPGRFTTHNRPTFFLLFFDRLCIFKNIILRVKKDFGSLDLIFETLNFELESVHLSLEVIHFY